MSAFQALQPYAPLFRQFPLWTLLLLLRHTAAPQYLVNGGDAISLQHRLGHSGLEMTSRYVHFASAELAAIQERFAPLDKLEIKPMRVPRRK